MKNKELAKNALIIAVYVAVSMSLLSLSFGPIQVRLAEALMVLCLKDKKYINTLTLACFVTNLVGFMNGLNPMFVDLVVGTLATYIAAVLMFKTKDILTLNKPIIALLMPALINGIMVGLELSFYFELPFLINFIYVAVGEIISVTIVGLLIYKPLIKALEQMW